LALITPIPKLVKNAIIKTPIPEKKLNPNLIKSIVKLKTRASGIFTSAES